MGLSANANEATTLSYQLNQDDKQSETYVFAETLRRSIDLICGIPRQATPRIDGMTVVIDGSPTLDCKFASSKTWVMVLTAGMKIRFELTFSAAISLRSARTRCNISEASDDDVTYCLNAVNAVRAYK